MLFFQKEQETIKLYVLGDISGILEEYETRVETDLKSSSPGKLAGKIAYRNLVKTPPKAQVIRQLG